MELAAHLWRLGILFAALSLISSTYAEEIDGQTGKAMAAATPTPQLIAWRVLSNDANSKNGLHRQAAMNGLSIIKGSTRALKIAEQGLKDEDASVREAAVFALGQMGSRRAALALRTALDDQSTQVRFEAAKALWAMGDHSGRSVLLDVLQGKSSPSDGAVKSGIDYANKKLHDPKALAWMGVTRASRAFLGPFSLGLVAVEEFAKDKSAAARAASASLLGEDNDPASLRELQDSLQDSNWVVRREAAKGLGQRSCENVIPDLKQLLKDHHEAVKCMAAGAIVNLSTRSPAGKPSVACTVAPGPALAKRASTE